MKRIKDEKLRDKIRMIYESNSCYQPRSRMLVALDILEDDTLEIYTSDNGIIFEKGNTEEFISHLYQLKRVIGEYDFLYSLNQDIWVIEPLQKEDISNAG